MAFLLVFLGLGLLAPLLLDSFETSDGETSETENVSETDQNDPATDLAIGDEAPLIPLESYISGQDTPDGFNIEIQLFDEWTIQQEAAIYEAAEYLSDIIVADIADTADEATGLPIDDLLIGVRAEEFEIGPRGGTIGDSLVLQTRDDGFTAVASLRISPDLDITTFRATILHEMIHALGIGNDIFTDQVRTDAQGQARFTGPNAIAAYEQDYDRAFANDPGSANGVPVEQDGFHWSEERFGNVLLTPDEATGVSRVGSITLAALEDIGYDTLWDDVTSNIDATGRFDLPLFGNPSAMRAV